MNPNPKPQPSRPETDPQQEILARFRAFPKRYRKGWAKDFSLFVLECGHQVAADLPLDDDCRLRCVECYREAMVKAEKLMEGLGR